MKAKGALDVHHVTQACTQRPCHAHAITIATRPAIHHALGLMRHEEVHHFRIACKTTGSQHYAAPRSNVCGLAINASGNPFHASAFKRTMQAFCCCAKNDFHLTRVAHALLHQRHELNGAQRMRARL